jgi:hypothetical protein
MAAGALALAAAVSMSSCPAAAAQSSSRFGVTVNLETSGGPPSSAFCRTTSLPGSFGATVTIVCSTGVVVDIAPSRPGAPLSPMHGGSYRYLTQVSVGGQILGTVDLYSGLGTITSWRVVNLVDRQYVEMTLNW